MSSLLMSSMSTLTHRQCTLHTTLCQRRPVKGTYRRWGICHDVEEAGAALALGHGLLPDEVLLSVAGHLRRRARRYVVPADATPVALQGGAGAEWIEVDESIPLATCSARQTLPGGGDGNKC